MRKNRMRMAVAVLLVCVMLLSIAVTAFAAGYTPVDPDDQGKTGIVGGDTLAFSEDTVWANLTARWGVRVIFQDGDEWNNTELQNELLPVTDGGSASTTAPGDPAHDGWTFTGWERVDENTGSSTLNEDGSVTGINGPGPIIYRAKFEPIPPKAGSLTVSKTISGNAADATKAFTFTVTLSDTAISGTYGDMTFENGIATFTLKGGESKTAEGLPDGVSYIVTESDNDGYEVTKTGDTGTIADGETATAAFTNTKNSTPPEEPDDPPVTPKTGSLTISKTVAGTDGDTNKAFTFTVTLGAEGSFEYTGSSTGTIANGGTVELKHGESITITGLPEGTSYMVAESASDGYEVTKTGDTGTIGADTTVTAAFTNTKDAEPTPEPTPVVETGSLTISKTVTGDLGDREKYFSFTVEFSAEGSYSYTGSKSGTISSGGTVQLKHGQSITISGLPAGTSYSVTESGNTGYRVYTSGDVGKIAANSTSTAKFTNARSKVPITGDNSNTGLWVGLLLASAAGIGACIVMFKKKKRGGKHVRALLLLVMVGVMAFSGFGINNAFAAEDGTTGYTYGQYDMTYLPGTTDTVTNMPANETGLTPGANNPYTVSSTVPVREGFEFIDWTLTWGTMEKPIPLTSYTVKYLDKASNEPVAEEKTVSDLEVGTSVTETAVEVDGYTALDPTEATIELIDGENVIIFYYEKQPVLTDYVVKYLDKATNEPVAEEKTVSDLEVGTEVSETAIEVEGYTALDPTEATIELIDGENVIIFYYEKQPVLTDYVVKYLDKATNEPVAEEKTVSDLEVGTSVTETAVEVDGYTALDPTEATIELIDGENVITFYYEKAVMYADYTVKYLEKDTNNPVADEKTVMDVAIGTEVSEDAITVEGYDALDPTSATIEIVEGSNEIIFWYEKSVRYADYTVKYLEKDTNNPVADEKIVTDVEIGTEVSEDAIAVEGYNALDPTSVTIEIVEGSNEIIFWYEKSVVLTEYTVKYLNKKTNRPLAMSKTVTDVPVGSSVTEQAIDIEECIAEDPTEVTIVLAESGNEIIFWYTEIGSDG